MIDSDGAILQGFERAILSECHAPQMLVIADTNEDKIGVAGSVSRRRRGPALKFRAPSLSLTGRAIVDGDVMLPARREMPRHGKAHDAEPDEGDFAHGIILAQNEMAGTSPAIASLSRENDLA